MKTIKAAAAAVVAMAMISGVAHAGLLGSIKGGLSKAVGAVKQAPKKTVSTLKAGWKAYDDAVAKHVGAPTTKAFNDSVKGVKAGWKAYDDAVAKHVGAPITKAFHATVSGLKTATNKTKAVGSTIVRGAKKAVSKMKALFGR